MALLAFVAAGAGTVALRAATLAAAPAADPLEAAIGQKLFRRQWVSAPSSTKSNDGLGPLYVAPSCAACHPGGGAGPAPVVRFGNGLAGDPVYGRQLQPLGVLGLHGEGTASIRMAAGGPAVTVTDLAYGPLAPATRIGLRRPPALAGLAAIDALGDDAILAGEGRHGGRARRLAGGRIGRYGWKAGDATLPDQIATAFSLDMGMSTATHPDPHGDCTAAETACLAMPTGSDRGEPEIAPPILHALVVYLGTLQAPGERDLEQSCVDNPGPDTSMLRRDASQLGRDASRSPPPCGEEYEVGVAQDAARPSPTTPTLNPSPSISDVSEIDRLDGKPETSGLLGGGERLASRQTDLRSDSFATTSRIAPALFAALGCAGCHTPVLRDAAGRRAVAFSDFLLHDMGPALDDGIAEPGAASSEWRTAPLIGLGRRLEAGRPLLHDGRAGTVAEAVAAHGGTAAFARDAFAGAAPEDRALLESYLKGL